MHCAPLASTRFRVQGFGFRLWGLGMMKLEVEVWSAFVWNWGFGFEI